ncbi:hypothetical protein B4Q04_20265 [Zobellia sp. OII3]|uniref:BfmA/BtgA family mobilization protein n=1 Tax=Zobellia sp. OII3 TaxID=2034520 RepID=UPI000B52A12D|nr:BfmA/BtgA family mobilization protein [Zobellia sp. OII3]OWW23534.1 hypothetical protein B4Q04_20265 [Zobellia sp. OII3]
MEDSYKKYHFSAINIKKGVAVRFRNFSRMVSASHTRTLETVMNFFEWNDLSPNDDLGIKNNRTNKRINAVIAILKNIEKHQTLPTKAMLDTLFQEISNMESIEDKEEDFDFGSLEPLSRDTELQQYRNRYEEMQEQLGTYRNRIQDFLEKLTYVKGTFIKGHYKLDMDKNEFEKFKREL